MTNATLTERTVPAGNWTIDPAHSSASFEVEHGGISVFRGSFSPLEATLVADDSDVRLEGAVKVAGVSIDDENIRPHLLSPEFFDAERHPEITFRSTEITGSADELHVTGELSMAGVTRPVSARGRLRGPADFGGVEKLSLSLTTAIDRTDYGMKWQMELPSGGSALANEVRLVVELELAKE